MSSKIEGPDFCTCKIHSVKILTISIYSKYHIYLQILVGVPSATTLLQNGIPFLLPFKITRPYIVLSAT